MDIYPLYNPLSQQKKKMVEHHTAMKYSRTQPMTEHEELAFAWVRLLCHTIDSAAHLHKMHKQQHIWVHTTLRTAISHSKMRPDYTKMYVCAYRRKIQQQLSARCYATSRSTHFVRAKKKKRRPQPYRTNVQIPRPADGRTEQFTRNIWYTKWSTHRRQALNQLCPYNNSHLQVCPWKKESSLQKSILCVHNAPWMTSS